MGKSISTLFQKELLEQKHYLFQFRVSKKKK